MGKTEQKPMSFLETITPINEVAPGDVERFQYLVRQGDAPVVCPDFVSHWPIVCAGKNGFNSLSSYLLDRGSWSKKTGLYIANDKSNGRFGYGDTLREFNFRIEPHTIEEILKQLRQVNDGLSEQHIYAGSIPTHEFFPVVNNENSLPIEIGLAQINLWMGGKTNIAAHFDASENIACAVYGTRRFTVFPPEQIENLYIGPLDRTPAGQSISLVNFDNPDFEQFPKFRVALEAAQTMELKPGDAIYIPSMWWHQVACSGPVGVLMNFWWRESKFGALSPSDALIANFLAFRELPARERRAWGALFEYYFFGEKLADLEHLSAEDIGVFDVSHAENIEKLTAYIINSLNRRTGVKQ